jgi:hypothetical protein
MILSYSGYSSSAKLSRCFGGDFRSGVKATMNPTIPAKNPNSQAAEILSDNHPISQPAKKKIMTKLTVLITSAPVSWALKPPCRHLNQTDTNQTSRAATSIIQQRITEYGRGTATKTTIDKVARITDTN